MISRALRVLFIFSGAISLGCATYQTHTAPVRQLLREGQTQQAVSLLEPFSKDQGRDQLAYTLDYALALYADGKFQLSIKNLLIAEQLAQYQDYVSLSMQTESLLLGQERVQYKGVHYENLMIHVYLALNFIATGDYESARVQARRINEIMEKYRIDQDLFAGQNILAYSIAALMWELDGNFENASIEYERLLTKISGLKPNFIVESAFQAAAIAGRDRLIEKVAQGKSVSLVRKMNRSSAEVIVIFEKGWAPRLGFSRAGYEIPELYPIYSDVRGADVVLEDQQVIAQTEEIYSVEKVAMETLQKDLAGLVAKRIAGKLVKSAVANRVAEEDELAGALVHLAMEISDRADLRQWSLLPQSIQMARAYVPEGQQKIKIVARTTNGLVLKEKEWDLDLKAGQKIILPWRVFQ